MSEKRCGNIQPHPVHEWISRPPYWEAKTYSCPGAVVVEGAAMPLCSLCGEQPAAAHAFGWCRWCYADSSFADAIRDAIQHEPPGPYSWGTGDNAA